MEARVVDKDSDASGTYRNARRVTSATRLWLAVGRSETAARATVTQQLSLTVHGTVPHHIELGLWTCSVRSLIGYSLLNTDHEHD